MKYIDIEDDTYLMLTSIQKEINAKDIDETIKKLIAELKKPSESMFGSFKGMPKFKRDDQIDRFP